MNHKNNQTRVLLAFFTLIAFSMPSQVKAMEMERSAAAAAPAEEQVSKPWHQKIADAVTKRLNAASEAIKNKIDDFTKAPRKYAVNEQNQVEIDGRGNAVFDSNWISKAAKSHTSDNSVKTSNAIDAVQGDGAVRGDKWFQESAVLFREDLAKAHRLDIQNASVDDLKKLQAPYLKIILKELTPQQLSDMVGDPGYTFPQDLIPDLSAAQAKTILKFKTNLLEEGKYTQGDIDALEARTKSVFQRALDALKPKKSAARSDKTLARSTSFEGENEEGMQDMSQPNAATDLENTDSEGNNQPAPAAAAAAAETPEQSSVTERVSETPRRRRPAGLLEDDADQSQDLFAGETRSSAQSPAAAVAAASSQSPVAAVADASSQSPAATEPNPFDWDDDEL